MPTGSCKIADALKSVQVDKSFLDETLGSNRIFWETFCKNNSHILRAQLFELFDAAKLTREAQFTVYFISSKAKNVTQAWADLEQKFNNFKSRQLYKDVEKFLNSHVSQYAPPAGTSTKFPIVNIPSTLPPMDILCCMLQTKNLSLDEMLTQITSVQLNLNKDAQAYAKKKFMSYWKDKFIADEDLMMRELREILASPETQEEFYLKYAGDEYNLTTTNFQEICPAGDGYTLEEIGAYLLVEASPEFLRKDSTMMSLDDVEMKWKNDRALTPMKSKVLDEMREEIEDMLTNLREEIEEHQEVGESEEEDDD